LCREPRGPVSGDIGPEEPHPRVAFIVEIPVGKVVEVTGLAGGGLFKLYSAILITSSGRWCNNEIWGYFKVYIEKKNILQINDSK
jgi:hypothetical protein